MFGPISESLITDGSQDISGSVGQKESIFGSCKPNIYHAVSGREGATPTKTSAAYSPSNLGEKENRS